ncbi:DUF6777 domain-containing protein [Kitasatospora sp. NPDC092039]|uniref:DUF6777 domain-containing protein n=1 Tax=Kitasatospora sp. NPDC092039 TaxID=3364086 RepID=UPI00380C8D05
MAAGAVAAAVVATVLITTNNKGGHDTSVPTANEVALQTPADPGPAPFTPSVETQGVSAPAPAPVTPTAQQPGGTSPKSTSPAALHSVEGGSAGLYGGTMNKPSCDTERLIGMVSTGDAGRAWASAAGIAQADIPGYLRSLTSAYLRVDTRVTNHSYKSGAVVEYQSALQAGTAVLVDSQGVPRVRCSCGNPLKPPKLVSNAKYTGKPWTGFQPTTLVVVVPAPRPVTEIILVNIETGGWFARLTGRIEIVDRHVEPPKGPLVPGIPAPGPWKPSTPSGSATASGATTSGATSSGPSSSGATSSGATSSGPSSSGATSSGATSSTSSGQPSGSTATTGTPSSSTGTSTATRSPTGTTSGAPTATGTGTGTTSAGTTTTGTTTTATGPNTPTATCATTAPSTLPPCPTTPAATQS